jgi:hypothetical protein
MSAVTTTVACTQRFRDPVVGRVEAAATTTRSISGMRRHAMGCC